MRSKSWQVIFTTILAIGGLYLSAPDAFTGAAHAQPTAPQDAASSPNIPLVEFELGNGLDVIVQENRSSPNVTVMMFYHVGSKNEDPRKTGSAHLFEHILGGRTQDSPETVAESLRSIGISRFNAFTSNDYTGYFAAGSSDRLDGMLWLEAQRMGHIAGALNQATLDSERAIVESEMRQRRGVPYGGETQILAENTYPEGHPYSWDIGGSMVDLSRFTLEDAQEWLRRFYGPNNATLIIVGDVSAAMAQQKVEQYFAAIPPGAPVERLVAAPSAPIAPGRFVHEASVPAHRLTMAWNTPPVGTRDAAVIDIIAEILGAGTSSHLHRSLITDKRLANKVTVDHNSRELGGQLIIKATANPDVSTYQLEAAIVEVLQQVMSGSVSQGDLDRARAGLRTELLLRLDSPILLAIELGENSLWHGDPAFYDTYLNQLAAVEASDIAQTSDALFAHEPFVLETRSVPRLTAVGESIAGTKLPGPGKTVATSFAAPLEMQLSNGMRVVALDKPNSPVFAASLVFEAGAMDDPAGKFGLSELTTTLLAQGRIEDTQRNIGEELVALGAQLTSGADLEYSKIGVAGPLAQLQDLFSLLGKMVSVPAFPADAVEAAKRQQTTAISGELGRPLGSSSRLVHDLLFDPAHPYARPKEGLGYGKDIATITRADVAAFHREYITPANSTLVIAGSLDDVDLKPALEASLGSWKPSGGKIWGSREVPPVQIRPLPRIILVDNPNSPQSSVNAAMPLPPMDERQFIAFDIANNVVASSPSARLSQNLRVEKGWSYGAGSIVREYSGQRYLEFGALVRADKTAEALKEMIGELEAVKGPRPITQDEFEAERQSLVGTVSWNYVAVKNLLRELERTVYTGRPADHAARYLANIETLTLEDARNAAIEYFRTDQLVWVVTGDVSKIRQSIADLGLGAVEVIKLER